jgi:hypothetical protein
MNAAAVDTDVVSMLFKGDTPKRTSRADCPESRL